MWRRIGVDPAPTAVIRDLCRCLPPAPLRHLDAEKRARSFTVVYSCPIFPNLNLKPFTNRVPPTPSIYNIYLPPPPLPSAGAGAGGGWDGAARVKSCASHAPLARARSHQKPWDFCLHPDSRFPMDGLTWFQVGAVRLSLSVAVRCIVKFACVDRLLAPLHIWNVANVESL